MRLTNLAARFGLSLVLGAACVVAVACRGQTEPAPPTETSTPLPTQTSTPLPNSTGTPLSGQINTSFGQFVVAGVEAADRFEDNIARAGQRFLVVRLEPGNVVPHVVPGSTEVADLSMASYVTDAAGERWGVRFEREVSALVGGAIDSVELFFEVPAGANGFALHLPGNDPIALPEPSVMATPTP